VILVFCDGSITSGHWGKKGDTRPAECWYGWLAKREDGSIVHEGAGALGAIPEASANVSEYSAISAAMRWLYKNGHSQEDLIIHSDSQLVIYQLSKKYLAHDDRRRRFRDHVWELASYFKSVDYKWIRREMNTEADKLSKSLQNIDSKEG
jgi:ribonuclease HI